MHGHVLLIRRTEQGGLQDMLLSILRLHENLITTHRDERRAEATALGIGKSAVGLQCRRDQRADENEEDEANG